MFSNWFNSTPCVKIEEEPTSSELGPRGQYFFKPNRQGLSLCRYLWPVSNPVGIVFGIHGLGSHVGTFLLKRTKPNERPKYTNSVVEKFNKGGYSVASLDLQGCGRSEGFHQRRAFFYEFDDLVEDIADFIESVLGIEEGFAKSLPAFLFGASMGGCLAVHVAHRCTDIIAGTALLAPMLSLGRATRQGINRVYSALAEILNYLIPDTPLFAVRSASRYPEITAIWEADPATFKGAIRVRVGYQCKKAVEWVEQQQADFAFPFLIIHGTEDTLCDPQGSESFFANSKVQDKTLHMAEKMWHLLTAEPGHEAVLDMVLQWLQQRSPVGIQLLSVEGG